MLFRSNGMRDVIRGEQPRYAVAIVMDDAVSGGISVGPRMRQLMMKIFAMEGNG